MIGIGLSIGFSLKAVFLPGSRKEIGSNACFNHEELRKCLGKIRE